MKDYPFRQNNVINVFADNPNSAPSEPSIQPVTVQNSINPTTNTSNTILSSIQRSTRKPTSPTLSTTTQAYVTLPSVNSLAQNQYLTKSNKFGNLKFNIKFEEDTDIEYFFSNLERYFSAQNISNDSDKITVALNALC